MKKLLAAALAIAMTLSLAACGGSVKLVDVATEQGINLQLPSDMTLQSNLAYSNSDTLDVATFAVLEADLSLPLNEWTQEDFVASELSERADLKIISYENNRQIDGKTALVCKFSFTTSGGNPVVNAIVIIDDGAVEYIVNLMYKSDNASGSLATNLDACINSITIAAK